MKKVYYIPVTETLPMRMSGVLMGSGSGTPPVMNEPYLAPKPPKAF